MLGIALACALLHAPAAQAGKLYQCTGSSGEMVFSSSKDGYSGCKVISTYEAPKSVRAASTPALAQTALNRVAGSVATTALPLTGSQVPSLADVRGSARTTARSLGADALPQISLAGVRGSVPGADLPSATAVAGSTPGRWSYRESPDAASDTASVAASPDTQVLRGAVYRVVRPDGSVEYTNVRQSARKGGSVTMLFSYISTCVACNLKSPIRWDSVSLNLTAYAEATRAASNEYGVDEAFLRAIIHAESAFNPRALSVKGAQGLMQLMPGTASDMGVLDAFDTAQNIRGGARYLALMLRTFNGDEKLAAAAYNAGPGAVKRYSGVPPYAETQVYVVRVATLRKRYGAALSRPLAASGAP